VLYLGGEMLAGRFTYRYGLMTTLRERKAAALSQLSDEQLQECENVMASDTSGPEICQNTCGQARDLGGLRRQHMQEVRQNFMLSAYLADAFDRLRGVTQETRIEVLLETKPCLRVIGSVDKSNMHVDYLCASLLAVAFLAASFCMPAVKESHLMATLMRTLCMLGPIVALPTFAFAGVVLGSFVPDIIKPVMKFYSAGCVLLSRLPLMVHALALLSFLFVFMVASNQTIFADILFGIPGTIFFGIISLCEGVSLLSALNLTFASYMKNS